MPVLLRVDDDGHAVFDWQALCERCGIGFAEPAQRPLRSAPDPGVTDTALDVRVQNAPGEVDRRPREDRVRSNVARCSAA